MALKFNYKAKDNGGKTRTGVVEAVSPAQALTLLQENKLLVISLNEKKEMALGSILGAKNVSDTQIAQFTRLLSTMLSTGLPLTESLANLQDQNTGYFKEVIGTLLHDVQSGSTLSSSMSQFPKVFNKLYVALVKAGEASGKVGEGLTKLADSLETQLEFKGKVKGALLYPAIIAVFMIGVGAIMVVAVIPKISEVYKEFHADLPLPTQILLGVYDFITNQFLIVVLVLVAIFVSIKVLRQNKASDMMINNLLLKVPIFGPLEIDVELTVMTRTLSTLVASGVAILEALKITVETLGNNYLRQGLETATQEVEKGLPLSASLKNVSGFPPLISQMTVIGEETGTMDDSLMRVSKFFQESTERRVKGLTTALEPILIIVMGVAVGGLAIAVLLPMFNLVNVIGK